MIKREESTDNNYLHLTTNSTSTSVMTESRTESSTTINKEWQKHIVQDMRNYLVQKIITTLVAIVDRETINDERMVCLKNYARCVENEIFETANNREEYLISREQ